MSYNRYLNAAAHTLEDHYRTTFVAKFKDLLQDRQSFEYLDGNTGERQHAALNDFRLSLDPKNKLTISTQMKVSNQPIKKSNKKEKRAAAKEAKRLSNLENAKLLNTLDE